MESVSEANEVGFITPSPPTFSYQMVRTGEGV